MSKVKSNPSSNKIEIENLKLGKILHFRLSFQVLPPQGIVLNVIVGMEGGGQCFSLREACISNLKLQLGIEKFVLVVGSG